jgi:hypothetical protein
MAGYREGEREMKLYEAMTIGVGVGILYGALLWFIKSQIIAIYSQGIPFHTYYDPNMLAFTGALPASILSLLVILSYPSIYSFFEAIALRWKSQEQDDDEE